MEKLTTDNQMQSADLLAENVERLRGLFPEVFTEGKIDFAVLKEVLGGHVDEREEKYGLNWHGKRQARRLALTPSTGTLRPCPGESVDWETTQNLMIEGDNLEVLKLLQKSYAGKVKLIYIDPPYNTGKDFVYSDDYRDNIRNYLELTGQMDGEGRRMSSNTEASGRFHTDWLNMMYPRLRLARNLLKMEGVVFISIDDGEVVNLRRLCDEIFGEECFIAQMVWKTRASEDTRATTGVSTDHEYIICYARSTEVALRGAEKNTEKFDNPDHDPRGPWRSADLTGLATKNARPNLHYDLIDPVTQINYGCPSKGWRYEPKTMSIKIDEGRILFPKDGLGRPRHKLFLREMRSLYKNISSIITKTTTSDGTREVNELLDDGVFHFPKPHVLLMTLMEQATVEDDLVLDFFAGSGTTAHAVFNLNKQDGGNRRFILVQLPEPTVQNKYPTIAEITKERLRRVIKKLNDADAGQRDRNEGVKADWGFRVFKLDTSNFKPWDPDPEDLNRTLLDHVDPILPGRSEQDLLFELLLKLGLELTVPMETRIISGKAVHAIGGGALLVCLAEEVTRKEVEPLARGLLDWRKELAPAVSTTFIFRDSAFDDVGKTNLTAILEQNLFASELAGIRSL
ncbi:MAG: site-specific DNA-methyltransferase [Magnetococcales bacterium]|nr:site-specific DNA-methyltransferase [Magnetococcales bacterium]